MTHTSIAAKETTFATRKPSADTHRATRVGAGYEFVTDGNGSASNSNMIAFASSRVWG